MGAYRIFNVEVGFPSLEEARASVNREIKRSKQDGVKVLKVIHGWGSSGKGGGLRIGLRKSFRLRKQEGVIKEFILGENVSIFDIQTLDLLDVVPELRKDRDLDGGNEGVTLLVLK